MKKNTLYALLGTILVLTSCQAKSHVFSGTLELTEHSVGARVTGRLSTLLVDEGDLVKKGQLLGTLDRAEQTEKDYRRAQGLFEHGGATRQTLEQAELSWDDQRIVSPVDGVVLIKAREPGEIVTAGGAVVDIGDTAEYWVRIYIPEGDINSVRMNQVASAKFDGLGRTFKGHVYFISPTAEFTPRNVQTPDERATQTFAVKVMLDERDPNLRPGVAADVTFQ
jgi:multidrug resistance efflux pump